VAKTLFLIQPEVASIVLSKAQEEAARLPINATELFDLVLSYRFDNKDKAASKCKIPTTGSVERLGEELETCSLLSSSFRKKWERF
jgi:16S rRNA A1518/A1519 N6-dimethyltransferase RsmA/KsgA/DIM1 with predicted DNA glycosylase/AP lyase activity